MEPTSDTSARRAVRSNCLRGAPPTALRCSNFPDQLFPIRDISELGARLSQSGSLRIGIGYDGWIFIGDRLSISVQFRLVHILENQQAGIEFLTPSLRLKAALRAFFEPELTGASLWADLGPDMAFVGNPSSNSTVEVYRFSNYRNCEVEVHLSEGQLKRLHVCVRKNGQISDWVECAPAQRREQYLRVKRLIANISELEHPVRAILEKALSAGPNS